MNDCTWLGSALYMVGFHLFGGHTHEWYIGMSPILQTKQNSIFIYFGSHCGFSEEKLKEHFKLNQLGICCGKFTVWINFFKTIYESVCACVSIKKKIEIKCTYKVANYQHVLVCLQMIDLIQNISWPHSWDSTLGSYHPPVQKCKTMTHSIW